MSFTIYLTVIVFSPKMHRFIPVPIYNNRTIVRLSDFMNSQDKYVLVGLAK